MDISMCCRCFFKGFLMGNASISIIYPQFCFYLEIYTSRTPKKKTHYIYNVRTSKMFCLFCLLFASKLFTLMVLAYTQMKLSSEQELINWNFYWGFAVLGWGFLQGSCSSKRLLWGLCSDEIVLQPLCPHSSLFDWVDGL